MKLAINKKLKISLISLLSILICISSFLLFRELGISKIEEQKSPVYSYNNKGWINYTVFLKPNNLYEGSTLQEGKLYITEFVDYIRTTFNYEFSGERAADLKGTYEIVAKVQGFTGDADKLKNIWEKDFVVVGKKNFNIKETNKTIKEEVRLTLDPYNTFVTEIKEASKISSQTMLTLVMNINLEGTTDKGPIVETISPSLILPLDTAMFEIGGNTTIDKPGAIEETIQVQLPANQKQVLLYGVIIGVLTLILVLLILFIKIAPNKDSHEKMLKGIFKKHGDRLVALNSELIINGENLSYVKSMDDLVRIADEVGKPIMYKYSQCFKEINKFYISNEDRVYLLDISEMLVKDVIDENDTTNPIEDEEEIKIEF